MPFASTCPCGRPTYSFGGLCDRCVALQTLELPTTATPAQIDNAYRTLVKVWHPDRFQGDLKLRLSAEEKLKEINSAHEYLISAPAQEPPPGESRTKPAAPPENLASAPPIKIEQSEQDEPDEGFESAEVRRIMKRRQRSRFQSLPRILLQAGVVVGAVAMLAILWLVVDAILMANPKTAPRWEQYKAEMGRDLQSTGLRMWSDATGNLHSQKDESAPVVAPPATEPPPTPQPAAPGNSAPVPKNQGTPHIKIDNSGKSAQPYVTSGLTPMEVLAILGSPTSSSGEKMFYKGAEIDFRNGRVSGWSVDPGSAPIRVKLWPSVAPSQGLTQFALGSSKNDVIALQGTPTLFSDNKFGYGNSAVFFQNDHVVGWKEDPHSVRLRVAH